MPAISTSASSWAPKWFMASSRDTGTVTSAATLLTAVMVTDSATSPRARWVSRLAIVPPGGGAEQHQAHRKRRSQPEQLRHPERQQRRDHEQVRKADRDAPGHDEHPAEVGRRQRQPEHRHDPGQATGSSTWVAMEPSTIYCRSPRQGKSRPSAHGRGGGAARRPAREQAAAEERALERAVAVHAAAAEAGHLAGGVEAVQRLAGGCRTRASRSVCSPPSDLRVRIESRTAISGPALGSRMRCGAATRVTLSAQ